VSIFTLHKTDTETELIENCLKGNPVAQRKLYDRFAPKMMMVCRRYLKQAEDAEEVLSHGFIKVFTHLGDYKFNGSFEGWVRTIMVREALMYLRSKKNFIDFTDEIERYRNDHQVTSTADMDKEYLLKMIDELPTGYKTVFNMYAIDGYKHHEIAQHLGISESTSKTQLMRARALLKEQLDNLEKKTLLTSTKDRYAIYR
jgi:RNA polymerase sigma factor (sigma-70 family)